MANTKRPLKKRKQKSLNLFPYTQLILSLLFIIIGAAVLIWPSFLKARPLFLVSSKAQNSQSDLNIGAKPAKLYIPRLSRILYVSDGYVTGNRWIISQTGVSFYPESALPGTSSGNSVLYGHNTEEILGGLWQVQDGDFLYVVLKNGEFVKSQVFEKKEITPKQVEILNSSADSRLTIYTCSGFLDTARFVVVGKLVTNNSYI